MDGDSLSSQSKGNLAALLQTKSAASLKGMVIVGGTVLDLF